MTKDEIITSIMAAAVDGLLATADVLVTFVSEHSQARMIYDFDTDQYRLLIPENSKQDVIERAIMTVRSRVTQINAC